jgi:hypothetical protein
MTRSDLLVMWTLYDHPKDYPSAFVARKWHIGRGTATPTPTLLASPQLEDLREAMQRMGLTCLTRAPDDDTAIIETWL